MSLLRYLIDMCVAASPCIQEQTVQVGKGGDVFDFRHLLYDAQWTPVTALKFHLGEATDFQQHSKIILQ